MSMAASNSLLESLRRNLPTNILYAFLPTPTPYVVTRRILTFLKRLNTPGFAKFLLTSVTKNLLPERKENIWLNQASCYDDVWEV
jgi:hypothetical protein